MDISHCAVALKEWALTCRALQDGLQLVLLRKGGILDEDGVFTIEHDTFWLQTTYLHQSRHLVKPEYRELLDEVEAGQEKGENHRFIRLQLLAKVEKTYVLQPSDEEKLRAARHIWSDDYLDLRYGYRPEYPLLCAALRVYVNPEPYVLEMRPEYGGCRSWIELAEPLSCADARPAVGDDEFGRLVGELSSLCPGH